MFDSRSEIIGWVLAILVIAAMGVITFTGPYHKVNKTEKAAVALAHPSQTVKIFSDPKTIGRYQPITIRVSTGQAVRFQNMDKIIHTVTANDGSFDSHDIQSNGKSWTHYFAKAGRFPYYCFYHPGMKGTVVVQ